MNYERLVMFGYFGSWASRCPHITYAHTLTNWADWTTACLWACFADDGSDDVRPLLPELLESRRTASRLDFASRVEAPRTREELAVTADALLAVGDVRGDWLARWLMPEGEDRDRALAEVRDALGAEVERRAQAWPEPFGYGLAGIDYSSVERRMARQIALQWHEPQLTVHSARVEIRDEAGFVSLVESELPTVLAPDGQFALAAYGAGTTARATIEFEGPAGAHVALELGDSWQEIVLTGDRQRTVLLCDVLSSQATLTFRLLRPGEYRWPGRDSFDEFVRRVGNAALPELDLYARLVQAGQAAERDRLRGRSIDRVIVDDLVRPGELERWSPEIVEPVAATRQPPVGVQGRVSPELLRLVERAWVA